MKQYVLDEIRPEDYKQIKAFLEEEFGKPKLGGIYWIPIDDDLLTPLQQSHGTCRPFYAALELESDKLSCELLIRTRQRVRCDCIGYATQRQRNHIINRIDDIFEQLGIIT